MAEYTSNYNLEKPAETEFYDVAVQNGNMDKIDEAIASIDTAKADAKSTLADGDAVSIVDSADSSKTKRVLWSTFKSALGQLFVPLTRKINNKALSSDLNLTGEDIPTSDTDSTSISSQLSNKVPFFSTAVANAPIATARNLPSFFGFETTCTDIPITASGCGLTLSPWSDGIWGTQIISINRDLYYRQYSDYGNSVQEWLPIATSTPPEGYNLPLSDGISVQDGLTAVYRKNQFGEVVVHGDLVGQMQNGSVIATLPAGFRPIYTLEMPATCDFTAGRIQVNSAGEIRVTSQLSECSSLYFLAVFVAEG